LYDATPRSPCGADLNGRVEARVHDAGDPQIERVTDPDAFGRFDARQDGHVVRRTGEHLAHERLFSAGTVFEVDEQPIKAAQRAHFSHER
jgi:hypothetical protein